MATTLIQFRADKDLIDQAEEICGQLGIDTKTYLKICVNRLINEQGIPFSMKLSSSQAATVSKKVSERASTDQEQAAQATVTTQTGTISTDNVQTVTKEVETEKKEAENTDEKKIQLQETQIESSEEKNLEEKPQEESQENITTFMSYINTSNDYAQD